MLSLSRAAASRAFGVPLYAASASASLRTRAALASAMQTSLALPSSGSQAFAAPV